MTTMRVEPEPSSAAFSTIAAPASGTAGAAIGALPGRDPLTAAVASALSAMAAMDKKNVPIAVAEQTEAGLMGMQNVATYVATDQSNGAKLSKPSLAV
jgi:hypothetical protein